MLTKYRLPLVFALLGLPIVFFTRGFEHVVAVVVLAAFEVSSSFDNAILNTEILRGMTPRWRGRFLTYGVLMGVVGVRIVLPFALICVSTLQSPATVVMMALNDPIMFGVEVGRSRSLVAAFGGMFLCGMFLDFVLHEDETWIPISRQLKKPILGIIVIAAVVFLIGLHSWSMALWALLGLAVHFLLIKLSGRLEAGRGFFVSGLKAFLYLELLDSVFSLDGVVGAFALSSDLVDIMLGLTLGALSVRSMTVHFAQTGSLQELRYLKAGALWSIGVLAALMLVQLWIPLPDWLAMASIGLIAVAAAHSVFVARAER